MDQVTAREVTVVTVTYVFAIISPLVYFLRIRHHSHTSRPWLRYVLGCCATSAAAAFLLLLASAIGGLAYGDKTSASHWCLFACELMIFLSSVVFLNITVLFPMGNSWTDLQWYRESGTIVCYASVLIQYTIAIGAVSAIIFSWVWFKATGVQPLLWLWAIPLPAYLAYACLAWRAALKVQSETAFLDRCRIYCCVMLSSLAFLTPAGVLVVGHIYTLPELSLALYGTQCIFWTILLLEKWAWNRWLNSTCFSSGGPTESRMVDEETQGNVSGFSLETLLRGERRSSTSSAPRTPIVSRIVDEGTRRGDPGCSSVRPTSAELHNPEIVTTWHTIFLEMEHGALFRAPIEKPQMVLAIGIGIDDWASNMKNLFPNVVVHPVPVQHPMMPCQWQAYIDDANHSWSLKHTRFDLVYIRGLAGCIDNWLAFFQYVLGSLREEAYLEYCDITLPKSVCQDQWLQSSQAAHDAGQTTGRSFDITDEDLCQQRMVEAGFVDVKATRRMIDLGRSKTSKQGVERDLLGATIKRLQGVNEYRLSKLGWVEEEINKQSEQTRRELEDPDVWPYVEVVRVIGQKPRKKELSEAEVDSLGVGSVLDGEAWTRHTRVYGGGVCLACASAGRDHGEGGYHGKNASAEESLISHGHGQYHPISG